MYSGLFTLLLLWLITRARGAYFEASTAAIPWQAHAIHHFGPSPRADAGHRHAVRPAQSGKAAKARSKLVVIFATLDAQKFRGYVQLNQLKEAALQAEPTVSKGVTDSLSHIAILYPLTKTVTYLSLVIDHHH